MGPVALVMDPVTDWDATDWPSSPIKTNVDLSIERPSCGGELEVPLPPQAPTTAEKKTTAARRKNRYRLFTTPYLPCSVVAFFLCSYSSLKSLSYVTALDSRIGEIQR